MTIACVYVRIILDNKLGKIKGGKLMAQGAIRKGFFFYFGLFALLLISIFLVCLVVMMFNPGSTVLWMQYFTANDTILVSKTTDDSKTAIDLSSISTLEINCSYANVIVQKNNDFDKDGIYIVNKAKGFTAASSAVKFDYTATFVGNTLKIEVSEPTGFLYFSKDIEIVVHSYTETALNFSGLKLKVVDTEGNVQIGAVAPKETANVKLSSLSVETVKGNIDLHSNFDTLNLTSLSLTSEEGKIQSFRQISYENKTGNGIKLNCDASFKTNKGLISFDAVDIGTNEINIASKKGDVAIDYIKADVTNVACMQGNYKFGSIDGSLSFTNSEDSILAPNILADYISKDFTLSTRVSADVEPDVNIKEIRGDVVVIADKGRLVVKKAHGAIDVSSENQLVVDVIVADDKAEDDIISIINDSGETKIGFLGSMAGNVYLNSNSGKIIVNVTSVAKFSSTAYVNDLEGTTLLADNKIDISLGLSEGQTKNPLTVSGTSAKIGDMTIKTNSTISYNLVSVESLVA